jgi:ferric-dicitrate binding protein FerR (iron transport regulator)
VLVKHFALALLAAAGLASWALGSQGGPAPGASNPFAVDVARRSFTVTGTVVSSRDGSLVLKIDDHGHRIPFSLSPSVSASDLRAGGRVTVHYHPTGATGQVVDAVEAAPPRR